MSNAPAPSAIPPEELLAHAGFVRGIARAILSNDADADDAVQETFVRALSTGPRAVAARRSWLGAVVRNAARGLARSRARAEARDRSVAQGESVRSAADAAAQAETVRLVGAAVAALDEPLRTVVLLRHYEGLPPREIAARTGTPVDTVKSRLQHAHEVLRARLDGGGRREGERYRQALASFAGVPFTHSAGEGAEGTGSGATTVAAKGVVMVSSGKTIAVAAVVLLAVGARVWVVPRGHDDEADAGRRAASRPKEVAAEPGSGGGSPPSLAAPPKRAPAAAGTLLDLAVATKDEDWTPERIRALATDLPEGTIEGVVFDGRRPAPNVRVSIESMAPGKVASPGDATDVIELVTDAEGRFRREGLVSDDVMVVAVRPAERSARRVVWRGDIPVMRRRLVIVMGDGTVCGVVRDRSAVPSGGKRVNLSLQRSDVGLAGMLVETTTAADGTYVLDAVSPGSWVLTADLEGGSESRDHDMLSAAVRIGPGERVTQDLGPTAPQPLWTGMVRSGGGTPIPGPGWLHLQSATEYTPVALLVPFDAEGRFARRVPSGRYRVNLSFDGIRTLVLERSDVEIGTGDVARDVRFAGALVSGMVGLTAADREAAAAKPLAFPYGVELRADGSTPVATIPQADVNGDGRFRFVGVRPGRYVLSVGRPIYESRGPGRRVRRVGGPLSDVRGPETTLDITDRDVTGLDLEPPPR